MTRIISLVVCVMFSSIIHAEALVKDPLGSVQWNDMYAAFLSDYPVQFDERVIIYAPDFAEDPMNVPISVDATKLTGVKAMVIFADFNPIPLIAKYYPKKAKATLSFRFKIQQASPVRVAVLSDDDIWHIGGVWVNSSGGGCTVASTGRLVGNWADYLGDTYGKRWSNTDSNRVRFLIHHPMDTGLVSGIPNFYIEELDFVNADGEELAHIKLYEPINANPVLGFDLKGNNLASTIFMRGEDNNGNEFEAEFVK